MQAIITFNDDADNPTVIHVTVLGFHSNHHPKLPTDHYVTATEDGWNTDVINLNDVQNIEFPEGR